MTTERRSTHKAPLWMFVAGFALLLAPACGNSDPPFTEETPDASSTNDTPDAAPTGGPADAYVVTDAGPFACTAAPTRMIILGDSIAACSGVGGKEDATCGPKLAHGYIESNYATGIKYSNLAVPGAITADVPANQLDTVPTGVAGHVLVLIYAGGNDLQPNIFASDATAVDNFSRDMPAMLVAWGKIFDFFNDTSKFPDGATIMMNTQYNPFDDCTASPYNLSATKIDLLWQFNAQLSQLAAAHENAIITDQHKPYLGHGHHYGVVACPYYQENSASWMADLIHPNVAGHANLAEQWNKTADAIFRDCQ